MLVKLTEAAACGDSDYDARFEPFDVMCHIGSLIETLAFMQHDMLLLRVLEVISSGMLASYSFIHTKNGTDCHFIWYIVHFLVNFYHIAMYVRAYFSISFTDIEARLFDGIFSIYNRAQFRELKRRYQDRTYMHGGDLMTEGNPVQEMLLLTSGSVQVVKGGEVIDTLNADVIGPQFFGEMSYFTMQAASATIRVHSEEAHAIAWNMDQMRQLSSSSGHSLVEITFRQLPALFAAQLAHRATQASAGLSQYKQSQMVTLSPAELERLHAESQDTGKTVRSLLRNMVLGRTRSRGVLSTSPSNRNSIRSMLSKGGSMASMASVETANAPHSPSSPSSAHGDHHRICHLSPDMATTTGRPVPQLFPRWGSANTLGRPSSPSSASRGHAGHAAHAHAAPQHPPHPHRMRSDSSEHSQSTSKAWPKEGDSRDASKDHAAFESHHSLPHARASSRKITKASEASEVECDSLGQTNGSRATSIPVLPGKTDAPSEPDSGEMQGP
eukprot:CAMPEP_0178397086 /NCGR_PEP_ID=MMETSP0689_2-20121128/14063_1 /TAXON_ID=160604 /ORGANISM="Amphidinium massartii, Strain CS-259" /LENGTH=497 /DNA_ID=CAMNT_0020017781 /DNA_START=148 /DNA_END=1644 /DNA_ORIENTATION=-